MLKLFEILGSTNQCPPFERCHSFHCEPVTQVASDQLNVQLNLFRWKIFDFYRETRVLVSGRSPACSDCLLRFYGAVITSKKNKMKNFFF